MLKVVWKSWGAPSHHLPFSLILSLSLPPHSLWAGEEAELRAGGLSPPEPPYFKPWPNWIFEQNIKMCHNLRKGIQL